jgi:hypothetical protein
MTVERFIAIAPTLMGRLTPHRINIPPAARNKGFATGNEAIMRQNQKNEEQTESRRGNHKEICRDQFLGMILQEGPPGLRGWLAVVNHVLGNRRLRELDAEFLEFTMNARCAPT